jgi:O-acetyl-ADP-ribose deacetylase (regulator of RNase III)/uncharacterized protein YwgA
MVRVLVGDIFESKSQTLVNTVNTVGVMGKGLALAFKEQFPEMYEDYRKRCESGEVKLGEPYLYRRAVVPWILNFPTKEHWRSVSRLDDIIRGLEYLRQHYRKWGITSLAVPPLGCGQGQLEWQVVGRTLYRHLKQLDIDIELFAPYGTPKDQLESSFLEESGHSGQNNVPRRIKAAWVALVEVLARIEREPFHRPVGRTIFQKIAYFATESGIPTGLEHEKSSYGPFAPNFKRLVTVLVNNGLIREEQRGKMFSVRVGPTFSDAQRTYAHEIEQWDDAAERIADLFMRMTTNQAEVAATVHFAAEILKSRNKIKPFESEILAEVMQWKHRRRPPLNETEVALAIRNLNVLDWLDAKASRDLPLNEEAILDV